NCLHHKELCPGTNRVPAVWGQALWFCEAQRCLRPGALCPGSEVPRPDADAPAQPTFYYRIPSTSPPVSPRDTPGSPGGNGPASQARSPAHGGPFRSRVGVEWPFDRRRQRQHTFVGLEVCCLPTDWQQVRDTFCQAL